MVIFSSVTWLALLLVSQENRLQSSPAEDFSQIVRSAMGKEKLPWYDAQTDSARPIEPRRTSDSRSTSSTSRSSSSTSKSSSSSDQDISNGFLSSLGNSITMLLFGVALALLIGLLIWFWKIYEPIDLVKSSKEPRKRGEATRVDSLLAGMDEEIDMSDPWSDAIRRRDRGDLSGAIICLFAHQLLTLSKLGLVRLAPGRTGRQLVKAVTDSELRGMVLPTLRLFEVVYYGHRSPTEPEFTHVWTSAESFERRIAAGVIH